MHLLSGRAAVTPFFHQPARTYVHRISCAAAAGILLALTIGVAAPAAAQIGKTVDGPKVVPFDLNIDLRLLPKLPAGSVAPKLYRPLLKGPQGAKSGGGAAPSAPAGTPGARAPMPGTIQNFAGLNFADLCGGAQCGGGWPPDPNGEVGPNHFIEAVNVGYAIYNKTGTLLASFTEDQLWAGSGANLCNGNSQGDPIVVYDPIADRWIITHFAFASGAGPFVQCIAVSKTSDPVAGGWYLYPLRIDTGVAGQPPVGSINDYPKFAAWHDCLYMGANQFNGFGPYQGVSVASFSRADLYNGNPLTWALGFLPYPANQVFSMFPAHSAGQGPTAVQPGTPAFFVNESTTAFNFDVRKLTPGPNCGGGGTLSAATFVPPDRLYGDRLRNIGAATQYGEPARQPGGSDHAEGPIPQGRRRRVAVGRPHGAAGVESVGDPVGAARRHRRHDRRDRGAAADLLAGLDALPLHAEHRRRQPGQRGDRFQHVGADRSRFPQHQVRRTPCGRPAQRAAADGSHARRGARFADESSAAAVRAIAGAITRR